MVFLYKTYVLRDMEQTTSLPPEKTPVTGMEAYMILVCQAPLLLPNGSDNGSLEAFQTKVHARIVDIVDDQRSWNVQ